MHTWHIIGKLLLLLAVIPMLQCGSGGDDNKGSGEPPTGFVVDTLAEGLEKPWGMVFIGQDEILITERPGRLRLYDNGQLLEDEINGLPNIRNLGQGGLLDIQKHPDYNSNGWIYIAYSYDDPGGTNTAIMRAELSGMQLVSTREIFRALPPRNTNVHFGCRLVFDQNNYLFASFGERGERDSAQSLTSHQGSIIRLHDDGSVPSDNPFVNADTALPEIWSYGHRNPQGLAFHPSTGELWEHEHGPQGGDEVNIIQKGKNYGWPIHSLGDEYGGGHIPDDTLAGIELPVYHWSPTSIAPCGMTFLKDARMRAWEENILLGALAGQHLNRLEVSNGEVVKEERLLQNMARFRQVKQGPDGHVYVLTESPGMLIRLRPEE